MTCLKCDHCKDKIFYCTRCNRNVTIKFYESKMPGHPLSELVFNGNYGSSHDLEQFIVYLCDDCIDDFYKFLNIEIEEQHMNVFLRSKAGTNLTLELKRERNK